MTSINYGSRRLVVGAHYGTRDWLAQRITAVMMAVYTVVVLVQALWPGEGGYDRWAGIFAQQWMKVFTFAVIIALAWHAWVGVRDILMDYVKPFAVKLTLQGLALIWLVGCAGWAFQVLWRL
jgi:succinate dehydrogenase / fumarate reductase membrane anchor subunit